jgi:hypothetical protein
MDCIFRWHNTLLVFLPVLPLFLLSLITYKLRDEVFIRWMKFARWWVPMTMFFILIAPGVSGGLAPLDKGRVGFFFSLLFLVISLVLIAWKWFVLRGK